MLERFLDFLKEKTLFNPEDTILLTVSGGIDSMTMLNLFQKAHFRIAVAHCNFQLRGQESEMDQEFVADYCKKNAIQFFTTRFETKQNASDLKISIQMAARELRYNWFHDLAMQNDFQKIATAHNMNDLVETFLINLTRGTGIRGLSGIKASSGMVIRPLLFASRQEIETYVNVQNIHYREDSSNSETKYLRNKIRHDIIPIFKQLNPSFLTSVANTTQFLGEADTIFQQYISSIYSELIKPSGECFYLDKEKMLKSGISPAILFEILSPFNFSFETIKDIFKAVESTPGIVFYSRTHKMVNDRTTFIIKKTEKDELSQIFQIHFSDVEVETPVKLLLSKISLQNFVMDRSKSVASFDLDKVQFPLIIRKWRAGDSFYPFGMKGSKKLSDYFTDNKFSLIDKEECWILCSGEDIIWIIGHRSDDRYKIDTKTSNVLQIKLISY